MKKDVKLIFEMSVEGRRAYSLDAIRWARAR
jgi:hypothetical protein